MYKECFICGKPTEESFDPHTTCSKKCESKFREIVAFLRKEPKKKRKPKKIQGGAQLATISRDWRQLTFQEYEIDQIPEKKPKKRKGGK